MGNSPRAGRGTLTSEERGGAGGQPPDPSDQPESAGTSGPAAPAYIALGRILRPHGVRGEVVVEVLTDLPERFETLEQVYLGDSQNATPYRLRSRRGHDDKVLLAFAGYPDRTSVEGLRGLLVQVPLAEAAPLPPDTYYPYQLIGMDVVTADGEDLGRLSDVLFAPANDVYVVNGPRGEVLLPAIHEVIQQIDLEAGHIVVTLIPGLVE